MSTKWKRPIRCPDCGSTAVRRREMVHKSGTSNYSGRSSNRGLSFGLTGKARPRVWSGGGSHSGKRQSIRAQEAEPLPFSPAIVVPILILLFRGEGESFGIWSWLGFTFSALWLFGAIGDRSNYKDEWLCSKCGATFIPEPEPEPEPKEKEKEKGKEKEKEKEKDIVGRSTLTKESDMRETESTNDESGKACSICGKWYPYSEFEYGNRYNRSYCQQCNIEEKAAYSQGGIEAAKQYREEKRAKWQKA